MRYIFPTLLLSLSLQVGASNNVENIIKTELGKLIKKGEPGCSVAYGKGSVTQFFSKGVEVVKSKTPLSKETRFLTASVSKQFTAHLAMILADKNKLDLNTSLENELPEIPTSRRFNTHQLMNHTNGISDHWSIFELQGKALTDSYSQNDALSLVQINSSLEFEPGTQFSYTNGGYVVLAELIEKITRTTLNQAIYQSLFKKLGINARYLDNPYDAEPIIHGHISNEQGQFEYLRYDSYIYGPGNLTITAKEFAIWANYLNTYITTNQVKFSNTTSEHKGFNYYAGLFHDKDVNDRSFYHHGGYYEHATQDIVLIPETQEFIISLCNRADFRPAKLNRHILSKLGSLKIQQLQAVKLSSQNHIKTGFYANKEGTKSALISIEKSELYYYGDLVGSPKKLTRISERVWGAQLSASKVFIELISNSRLKISNEQKEYKVQLQETLATTIVSPFSATYLSNSIGNLEISISNESYINFPGGLGKIPLTCNSNKLCFSEYGYLILNMRDLKKPILSTHPTQNLRLIMVSQNH